MKGSIELHCFWFSISVMKNKLILYLLPFLLLVDISCTPLEGGKGKALFESQCASCHLLPEVGQLPKKLWKKKVLPEMAARMGIQDTAFDPYEGYSFDEQYAMVQSGVYSVPPTISKKEWQLLVDYIISNAPDSLEKLAKKPSIKNLEQFSPSPIDIDSTEGSFLTSIQYDVDKSEILTGDLRGSILSYDRRNRELNRELNIGKPITSIIKKDNIIYATTVAFLDPSELVTGHISMLQDSSRQQLPFEFHRPVHTLIHDFDKNGTQEIVVCEFGNLTGQLSILFMGDDSKYDTKALLNQPGTIRTIADDMDGDGLDDLLVMTTQGDEGITIFYQTENLGFRPKKVLRFSPLYGSSWFELLDYDNDGDKDIITVHGDNGDKTPILKPYHGLRIHLNDGNNQFSEAFFYPFYGATRSVSRDFDQDGDFDIALVSTFPDYEDHPEKTFVYLENKNSTNFSFEAFGLPTDISGRWFLLDAGDFDNDGDDDIVLTCFTYSFNPLPDDLKVQWNDSDFDMVIFENDLLD